MTRRQASIQRRFPTVGGENDRQVPWRSALTLFPVTLIITSASLWLMNSIGVGYDWRAGAPGLSAMLTIAVFCGEKKYGSRARYQPIAITTAAVLSFISGVIGVHVFPHASHVHPGPLRWLVYTASSAVAVGAFTTVTRQGLRDTRRQADVG